MTVSRRTRFTAAAAIGCTVTLLLLHTAFRSAQRRQAAVSYEASSTGTQTPMEAGIAPAEKDTNRAEIGLQERDINAHDTNAANDVSKLIADALNVERERTNRPLSETDIESIGKTFKKDEWSNAGFGTIPSLIQTYYFALREGQVRRVSDCETPKE